MTIALTGTETEAVSREMPEFILGRLEEMPITPAADIGRSTWWSRGATRRPPRGSSVSTMARAGARRPQGFSEQAITAANQELEESAEEYAPFASLGIPEEPREGATFRCK